ncbi:protein kinase [Streptomyces sp. ZAF1911]|uniref:serine/threonine-protein kinase n=1 Tax=Streptomyces sp. ZAF1911 TaxID=2944129 RepID=UPI00237A2C1A|nr:protein kinase [Streptomyces sp. ZAF1911]MDD9378322.1 protein kinase [Streptomyces sp. ZAF1911]
MSKPEHTESPEPSVGTGSPVPPAAPPTEPKPPAEPPAAGAAKRAAAAKPGTKPAAKPATTGAAKAAAATVPPAAPEATGAAEPEDAKPGAAAAEPEPRKPELRKSEPRKPEPRKPAAAKAARGAEPEDAKPAAAVGAKPAGVGAEPEDAKPAAAVGAKPVLEKAESESEGAKPVEPEDAKPVLRKAEPAGAKPVEPEDAKPVLGKGESGGVKAAEAADAKPVAVSKADEVAAAVKAAAAKAGEGPQDEGRLLAGRYRLGDVLGKGGMGTVWRAEDETLGRTVAVKELRFGSGVDEDEKRRLITRTLREAKAIARIRSGGAVTVYDVVDEDGRPWIVMELIEGPSLAEFIRESGPLTPRRAAEVGLAVLDVLRAAHRQGILHRDVKPSNVLLADRGNGRVVLTDFGIAQVEGDPSVTSTGMLVGAPSYISPERARGQRPGPPADMWSLGGLLYAAVEGVPPYDKGSALATLTAVMTEPVEPPKNAGPLTEVIYGLLVKDPAHRLDDDRARALLTAVIDAPEPPAPVAVPDAEETRQISLTEAREAAEKAAADKAAKIAEKAEKKERERREREQRERARAALKSARKAAAASAAAATATAATAAESPSPRPAPVAAPLTDVMPRRTIALAIAGVVMALAVIGSIVAYAFSGDDEKDGAPKDGKGGSKASAASSPTPGSSTPTPASPSPSPSPKTGEVPGGGAASPDPGQSQGSGTNPGQGQGATPGGALPGLPPGYGQVNDPGFHFAMGLPDGFKQTGVAGNNSGVIYSRDGGFPRVQIDFNSSPKDDARAAWLELAPSVAGSSSNYKLLRLEKVEYRGYPTVADWEFERDQKGSRVRVLDRGFRMDAKHGYAIMITCLADQWDAQECTQLRTTAFDTFQPLG